MILLVFTVGAGSFVCNALISEGVSDIIFGIEGFVSGYCSMYDYLKHKLISIAITIATAGVGAWLARGKQVSKFAYKAFAAATEEVVENTVKAVGKSAFNMAIVKEAGWQFIKEVGGAVGDALLGIAIDKITECFSDAIKQMSAGIIDTLDSTVFCDVELRSKMLKFLQQKEQDQKSLHLIINKVLNQHTLLDIWDSLESAAKTATDTVNQGHGQAAEHLKMCGEKLRGQSVMKVIALISRFAPLVTETLKGASLLLSIKALRSELIKALDQHITSDETKKSTSDSETEKKLLGIVDSEIQIIKSHFTEEMSKRGQKLVKTSLTNLGKEIKKGGVRLGKKYVVKKKDGLDMRRFEKHKEKLEAAKVLKTNLK